MKHDRSSNFRIRPATRKELDIMIDWAAKEEWNPGLYDGDAFYAADPKGFLLGFLDEKPIASISAVAYDSTFGFFGFYIVQPEYRKKGYGIQMWNEAMKHVPTQNIGLDGVLTQQENYTKSGFKLAYRNIRYECMGTNHTIDDPQVISLSNIPFKQLLQYDKKVFPAERILFLKEWIKQPESLSIAYKENTDLLGYAMVKKCRTGFKVGPLFADNEQVADVLFQKLMTFVGEKQSIFLDTPEINKRAIALAERYKMKPMFETARMYTKNQPLVALDKTYSVTTFELG